MSCVLAYRFSAEDDFRYGYKYTVGICTPAIRDSAEDKLKTAGAIQVHKQSPSTSSTDQETHIVGSFERAEIMFGSQFHLAVYKFFET